MILILILILHTLLHAGADFDPSERAFDMEELRPQPIIRKRAKQFVSPEKKDDKYWENRSKNTVAARR